jgi:2-dehydro-3-deoxyphosphogluconate aldolase / (4S)-4-hydroxy-2-oxoglutarate aldolase
VTTPLVSQLEAAGLVPVVVLDDAGRAPGLARALVRAGLPVAEITFRTRAAGEAIRAMADQVPELLVGAGTLTSPQQVDEAVAAGARFAVTPGFNPRVVERCLERGLPVIPGVNAPGFIEMALAYDLRTLKFFPAELSGGIAMIKALSGPYGGVRFVPTGGIGPGNLAAYLQLPAVAACGGSWMVEPGAVAAGDFETVERATREAVAIVREARKRKRST